MRNLPIDGGALTGAPKDWDPATDGDCLAISVLTENAGTSDESKVTAWHLTEDERLALACGGVLFQRLRLPFVPVMQLWVQDRDNNPIGAMASDPQALAATRAAVLAIAVEIDRRSPESIGRSRLSPKSLPDLLKWIMGKAEAMPYTLRLPPSFSFDDRQGVTIGLDTSSRPDIGAIAHLPIKTLDDVAAESAAERDGRRIIGKNPRFALLDDVEAEKVRADASLDWREVAATSAIRQDEPEGAGVTAEFKRRLEAARGCEFDLTPADGPIAQMMLFVHEHHDAILAALAASPRPAATDQAGDDSPYLVWSNQHRAWWRPDSCGYTLYLDAAGRYSRKEAMEISGGGRDGWRMGRAPDEIAVREADVIGARDMQHPSQRNTGHPPLVAMIYDADCPSMTARFRIPEGLPLASGMYELQFLRSPTPSDSAKWEHLPEPAGYADDPDIVALVDWARRQGGYAGNGHIDERERFKLRDMVAAIDATDQPGGEGE